MTTALKIVQNCTPDESGKISAFALISAATNLATCRTESPSDIALALETLLREYNWLRDEGDISFETNAG